MRVIVAGFLALFATIGHAALFSSDPPMREWPEFRNDQPEEVMPIVLAPRPAPTVVTGPPVTTTTLAAPTTTIPDGYQPAAPTVDREGEVDPPPPPPVTHWHPEDECSRVSRPVSAQAMRWCGAVARYLHATGDWQPGDLTLLMRIIDCESRGAPNAVNPSSGTTGLFQHRPRYWAQRGAKAAAFFGFDNPRIDMPLDNIAVGVWLYKFGGGVRHWETCGRR